MWGSWQALVFIAVFGVMIAWRLTRDEKVGRRTYSDGGGFSDFDSDGGCHGDGGDGGCN